MARLSSYQQDGSLSGEDRLVGSSYEGLGQNGPIYKTRAYKLSELAAYFGGFISDGAGGAIDIVQLSQTVTDNTNAIASANQSITTITNDVIAQSTFQTNLAASFGTYDENGNLTSISQAHADQVLQATASDRYANAQFVTNLAASTGTYDANGNLVTMAEAFANQVLSTTTSDKFATSTFATNLAASFGTYNPDGTLATISESFANQLLQASTASDFADAAFLTTLASNFGTFDENGNLLTISTSYADQLLQTANTSEFATATFATNLASSFGTYNPDGSIATFSQSFADQVLSTANTSEFAEADFVTNLATSFGTYNPDGSIATFSSSFADQVLSTANTSEFAQASFVTNLASSFGTYDANGNLTAISSSFADDVLSTANTSEFAEASKLTALGASFGTVNPDGSVTFNNTSTYSNEILNYVDSSSALATQVSNLETTITNIPVTIRQPEAPDVNAYPLGSIWIDTDDSNAIYILVDGTPRTWEPTTSEALGDLILSNAQLEEQVNLLSTDLSAEATKLTTLTAQFGVYDPATDTFTINNNSNVIASLRTYADAQSTAASKVDGINSVFNIVDANGNVIKNLATFNQEITTYVDANSATAGRVDTLEVEVGDNTAAITAEQTARANEDSALASQISTLGVTVSGNTSAISAEQTARADADSANATYSFNIASSIGTVDANGNITAVSEAFANSIISTETTSDYASASRVDALEATVGDENSGLVASVTETSDAVASLEQGARASYGLTVGSGNAISSMKLLAEDPNQPGLPATSSIIFNTGSFKIQNGSGVDQFTINTTTGKAEFSGHLQAATGTFTGTLQAGDVTISNNLIEVDGAAGLMNFTENGTSYGEIRAFQTALVVEGVNQVSTVAGGTSLNVNDSLGIVGASNTKVSFSGSEFNAVAVVDAQSNVKNLFELNNILGNIQFTAGFNAANTSYMSMDGDGVSITGTLTVNGVEITGGGTTPTTERYLSGITRSVNTLTFVVTNGTNQTYTFGNNAFTNTTIPTNNNQLTNGAGYITSSALTGYATLSYVNNNFITTTGSYEFTGSLTAQDFILNSDRILKENIKEYKAKPINIQYKQYNIVGDEETRVGVIAQELEKDHPEFIRENDNGIKSVSYIDMLMAKVAELEARIKELEHGATS